MQEDGVRMLWMVAVVLVLGGVALAGLGWWRHQRRTRLLGQMRAVLQTRRALPAVTAGPRPRKLARHWAQRASLWAQRWPRTRWGGWLIAPEDQALLAQCGFQRGTGDTGFLLVRLGGLVVLPMAAWVVGGLSGHPVPAQWLLALVAVGYLLPKWSLRGYAAQRCKRAESELPLLVDLLALLQGSGQGLDQSLQVIAQDFEQVLPVLSRELQMANRLHASGRTRDQAFTRLSQMFRSANLADLTALLVQIDRHGGAVQEPLRQFSLRLQEQRRMRMKEAVGRVTVQMTGVMVLTLLPALLVITAGPGFLAVMRTLGGMK